MNAFLIIRSATIVCATIIAAVGINALIQIYESHTWPSVFGTIEATELQTSSRRRVGKYSPRITYSYTIDGKSYQNNRISKTDFSSDLGGWAKKMIASYPSGKIVKVYYNPSNHRDSLLQPGIHWHTFVPFAVGAVFLAAVIFSTSKLKQCKLG